MVRSVWKFFKSVSGRPGVDMGERARDLMVRSKFIAAQQSSALCRHLDGATVDAPRGNSGQLSSVGKSYRGRVWWTGPEISTCNFPGGGGSPITVGVDSIGHVSGEHGTGIVTSEGDS